MAGDDTLTLDLDGWEGPLDLLLSLARSQKVDLKQISILALVDQYLAVIEQARAIHADAGVRERMAALAAHEAVGFQREVALGGLRRAVDHD